MEAAHICGLGGQLALLRPLHFGHRPAPAANSAKYKSPRKPSCRATVQSEEANLQSHAAEAQAGAVCRDSLLPACPVPPSTSSRVHSPGWATNEGGSPAGRQELLHFALSPRVSSGPYQCTQKATNPLYTAGRCTHCHRRLPLGFIHRGLSAGRLKVEACAIH